MFGSTRDARQAGNQLAAAATATIVATTAAMVAVSAGCTPKSSDAISRFKESAPARPEPTRRHHEQVKRGFLVGVNPQMAGHGIHFGKPTWKLPLSQKSAALRRYSL